MTTNMDPVGRSPFGYTNYPPSGMTPAQKKGFGRSAGELPEEPELAQTARNPPVVSKRDPKVAQGVVIAKKTETPRQQLTSSLETINALVDPAAESGMSAGELIEYSGAALEGLEKVAGGLGGLLEKTGDISASFVDQLSETATTSGLEFLGDGLVLAKLAHSIANYRDGQLALEDKKNSLNGLIALSTAEADRGGDTRAIDQKISQLQKEIVEIATSQTEASVEMAVKLASSGCSAVEAGGKLAEVLASAGSAAAAVAPIIEAGASTAGAGVGGIVSAAKLMQDVKDKQAVEKKYDQIKAMYDSKSEGTLMHTLLGHKLSQLEQERHDILVSALRNYLGVGSSTVGLGVGIATLAGVSGAATAGIAPAVLAGTALLIGAGYGAYKYQDTIVNAKDRLAVYLPSRVDEFSLEHHAGKLEEIRTTLTEVEQKEQQQLDRQRKLEERLFTPITERVNKLKMERVEARDELFHLEFNASNKGVQTLAARVSSFFSAESKEIARLNAHVHLLTTEIAERESYVASLRSDEAEALAKIQNKKQVLQSQFSEVQAKVKEIGQRVLGYQAETRQLEEDKRYIDWAVNIQGMDWQQVRDLHMQMAEELKADAAAVEEARDFLAAQDVDLAAYDSDAATAILNYIAREEAV